MPAAERLSLNQFASGKPASSHSIAALASNVPSASVRADLSVSPPTGPRVSKLDVYQMVLPIGAVSRSDDFWKRVDETALDIATYDELLKNGIRVGVGDVKDWPYFKARIDENHAAIVEGSSNPALDGHLELPLKTKVGYQDLFWFDDRDVLNGRTFENSDNLLEIAFRPHERKDEHTSVMFCPMVRGLRKKLEFTVRDEEREFEVVYPETIFDLSARLDVAPEHFIILAPAETSRLSTSVGKGFFIKDGIAGRLETVLILVPHCYRLNEAH